MQMEILQIQQKKYLNLNIIKKKKKKHYVKGFKSKPETNNIILLT